MGGAARVAGSLLWVVWAAAARRPVDSFAIFAAVAASLVIIVNAVALQSRPRSTSVVVNMSAPSRATTGAVRATPLARSAPVELPMPRPAETPRVSHAVAMQGDDPIAELIGMSSRIMAVQRVLSNYGYGQLKPTGILDRPTSAAIERFEREHRLPVTGRISDRLVSELAQMAGHPLD
jgi:hypothetical protein